MIVYGKALKGGTLPLQADLLDRAARDLDSKLVGKGKVTALSIYEDDSALNLIAVVEEAKEGAKKGKVPVGHKGGK